MNSPRLIPDTVAHSGERIHFDNFEISWAGENSLTGNLCFGSDDGRFRTKDKEGPSEAACPSGEAVNGVALVGRTMAVSTRCDVGFIIFDDNGDAHRAVYGGGAHDVIATSSGGFIAPLGVHGILTMKPTLRPGQILVTSKVVGTRINFYKFATHAQDGDTDLIVGACRGGGLTILELNSMEDRINPGRTQFLRSPGLDVVDVCSLASPEWPRAFAWLGIDRTIHFSRDVLIDSPPKSIRIGNLSGKAYSLLHDRGHIFLLTTDGFYTFPDLATRFLSDNIDGGSARVLTHDSKSIDEIYMACHSLLLSIDGDIACIPTDSIVREVDRSGWSSSSEQNREIAENSWEKTIGPGWLSESKSEIVA